MRPVFKSRKTFLVLVIIIAVLFVGGCDDKSGSSGADIINKASGEVQMSFLHPIGAIVHLTVLNPKIYPVDPNSAVGVLGPVIMTILIPLWEMLILLNGIYFIWGARDPATRNAAKQRLTQLIVGMIICSLSFPIYQMLLEIELGITTEILEVGNIGGNELLVGYAGGVAIGTIIVLILVKLIGITLGTALCPIIVLLSLPFIALGLRYVGVIIFAILFPVTIFLYFFEFTRKLGSKLFRTTVMWIAMPIVQAVFIVVMVQGLQSNVKMHFAGGIIALASFMMIGSVPFMMEGLTGAIGGALIHSGYTSSNPRLILLGNFVSGQGSATFTQMAWYANMGMQQPPGGKRVMEERKKQLKDGKASDGGIKASVPVRAPPGILIKEEIQTEKADLKSRIADLEAKKADGRGDLDQEITDLQQTRKLSKYGYISQDLRRHVLDERMTYSQLKKTLSRGQLFRLMREQELGLTKNFPELLAHKKEITSRKNREWFSPGQLLRPIGSTLGGLMSHMISDSMPLGESLFGLVNKMTPRIEYETTKDGKKVGIVKEGWSSWGEVGKDLVKSKAVHAGLGLAVLTPFVGLPVAALGSSLIVGALHSGMSRELKGRQGSELHKLATSGELERLIAKSSGGDIPNIDPATGNPDPDRDRVDKIKTEFGMSSLPDAVALSEIKTNHVDPERRSLARLERNGYVRAEGEKGDDIVQVDGLMSDRGVERLINANGATDLTGMEKTRLDYLKSQDSLTKPQEEERSRLEGKKANWDDRQRLGALFGVDASAGNTNFGRQLLAVSGNEGLREYANAHRADRTRVLDQSRAVARNTGGLGDEVAARAGKFTTRDRLKLVYDETLLDYSQDFKKRDRLRRAVSIDRDMSDGMNRYLAAPPPLSESVGNQLADKYESLARRHGVNLRDASGNFNVDRFEELQGKVRERVAGNFDNDARNLGVGSIVDTKGEFHFSRLQELNNRVHARLNRDQNEDSKAYSRYIAIASPKNNSENIMVKNQGMFDHSELKSREREVGDLTAYLEMDNIQTRERQDSVNFQHERMNDSEDHREHSVLSKYADDPSKVTSLQTASISNTPASAEQLRDMNDLGIDATQPEALKQLYDTVSGYEGVKAAMEVEELDKIL